MDGLIFAAGALVATYCVLFLLLQLPDSILQKLAIKDRPAKPPGKFEKFIDRTIKKHGIVIWPFLGGTLVAGLIERVESWWQRAIVIALALLVASVLGAGPPNEPGRS